MPPAKRLLVAQDLLALDQLSPLVAQVDTAIQMQSTCAPWAAEVPWLIQQTGIGLLTAMTLLAAIGDIQRFAHPQQLVGYAGLGARVHASGETFNTGGITKRGRRELRAAMVEAAWIAAQHSAFWKAKFVRLAHRIGDAKAIVAIAHKLWTWAEQGGQAMRHGLTCGHFVRFRLHQLGIGQELTEWRFGSHVYRLPPIGSDASLPAAS